MASEHVWHLIDLGGSELPGAAAHGTAAGGRGGGGKGRGKGRSGPLEAAEPVGEATLAALDRARAALGRGKGQWGPGAVATGPVPGVLAVAETAGAGRAGGAKGHGKGPGPAPAGRPARGGGGRLQWTTWEWQGASRWRPSRVLPGLEPTGLWSEAADEDEVDRAGGRASPTESGGEAAASEAPPHPSPRPPPSVAEALASAEALDWGDGASESVVSVAPSLAGEGAVEGEDWRWRPKVEPGPEDRAGDSAPEDL